MSTIALARPSSRRSLLIAGISGIAAGVVTLGAHAALAEPDPVFAAIAKEKAAWDALEELSGVEDSYLTPEWDELNDAHWASLDDVFDTGATTPAGLIAALDLFELRARDWISSADTERLQAIVANAKRLLTA